MSSDRLKENPTLYENTIGEVGQLCVKADELVIPLWEVSRLAKVMGVSSDTIRRWIDEGKLIGIKVGRIWFVQNMSFAFAGEPLDEITF